MFVSDKKATGFFKRKIEELNLSVENEDILNTLRKRNETWEKRVRIFTLRYGLAEKQAQKNKGIAALLECSSALVSIYTREVWTELQKISQARFLMSLTEEKKEILSTHWEVAMYGLKRKLTKRARRGIKALLRDTPGNLGDLKEKVDTVQAIRTIGEATEREIREFLRNCGV